MILVEYRALPPGRILDIRYEDVVTDLEGPSRRMGAHYGLAWDPSRLAFHQTNRPVRTAGVSQVRQPIYQSVVGRNRGYEEFFSPLLAALGDVAPRF